MEVSRDSSKASKRRGAFSASWSVHVRKPAIPAVVLAASLGVYLVATAVRGIDPNPGDLSIAFAAPPLDIHTDAIFSTGERWLLFLLVPLRVLVVTLVLALVLGGSLRIRSLLKVGGVQFLGLISVGGIALVGSAYLNRKAVAALGGAADPLVPLLLIANALAYVVVVVVLAPLAARAAGGFTLRTRLRDWRIWLLGSVAAWLWLFAPDRIEAIWAASAKSPTAFVVSFVVLLVQSVLLGSIAIRSTVDTQVIEEPTST